MQNRVFRKLQIKDLDMVLRMNNDFRENFIHKENAMHFLGNPMNWIIACIQNNQIIGFAYGYELNRLDSKGNMLYIHEVGVLPGYQRQGIGLQLLSCIRDICKLTGICRFYLITYRHNYAACALYEKAGGIKSYEAQDDEIVYYFTDF